jgi:hypothetical protein
VAFARAALRRSLLWCVCELLRVTGIIPSMRHWLLILLMTLLPLRGWAGVSMTVSMPVAPVGVAAATPHCEEHAAGAAADAPAEVAASGHHAHTLCDVCNGPAMATSDPFSRLAKPLPQAREVLDRVVFISVVPQRGHKPPIP